MEELFLNPFCSFPLQKQEKTAKNQIFLGQNGLFLAF
jgi:hypothetical protein